MLEQWLQQMDDLVRVADPNRALQLLGSNQWNTLLREIYDGLLDVNFVAVNGLSLLMMSLEEAPSLVPSLVLLGANVNQIGRENKTVLDQVIARGALEVPRRRLTTQQEIIDNIGRRQAQGQYLFLRSQGAMTAREIANRGVAEVVVTQNLPHEFSREIINFLQPRPPVQGPRLNVQQQRELEEAAVEGLVNIQPGIQGGKSRRKTSKRKH